MECGYARIGQLGRESARRRSSRTARLMAACGLVALLAIALPVTFVAQRVEVVRASTRRDEARARAESLKKEWGRKSLELARAESLDRVDWAARTELGMVDPVSMGIVVVDARPAASSVAAAMPVDGTAAVSEPPTVLASFAGILEQMAVAAVSNLVAAWSVVPPARLPSVLE